MSRAPWVLLKPERGYARTATRRCTRPRSAGGWSTRRCRSSGRSRSARAPRSSPTATSISREAQDEFAVAQPPARGRGVGRRAATTTGSSPVAGRRARARRGHPRRHARSRSSPSCKPAFAQGRHGHGRQRLAAQRRRRRAAARRRGGRRGDRPRAAGADRRPRRARRRPRRVRDRARSRPPTARSRAPASAGATSTSSSSTRRSPRSRWPAWRAGRSSTRRASTSTAARSRSATRSAPRGARILGTLAHELRRRGGGCGLAAICIGVGQGLAVVLEA